MNATRAMILLSGGLDSVAAMHWARETFSEVRAVSINYGQVQRDAEMMAAQRIAERRGVPWSRLVVLEAVKGGQALAPPKRGVDAAGVSRANLPLRNLILIGIAAAHGCRVWGDGGAFDVVIGCNQNDAAAYPDCRPEFIASLWRTLALGCEGVARVGVRAPWIEQHKSNIVYWAMSRADALTDIRASVSCYHGTSCGDCDACALRALAFRQCRIEDGDGTDVGVVCGGDAHRDARFK